LSAVVTSWFAVVRLSVAGVAVTVAVRSPRCVVTVAGPLASATVATELSGTIPLAVGIGRSDSPATVVGGLSLCR
jgi:hypothetical protein